MSITERVAGRVEATESKVTHVGERAIGTLDDAAMLREVDESHGKEIALKIDIITPGIERDWETTDRVHHVILRRRSIIDGIHGHSERA